MKNSLIIGTMLGLATATALYCSMTNNSLKKAKRAFVNKQIHDLSFYKDKYSQYCSKSAFSNTYRVL